MSAPPIGIINKKPIKKETIIDTVKIAYLEAPHNALSREESHTEWRTNYPNVNLISFKLETDPNMLEKKVDGSFIQIISTWTGLNFRSHACGKA